MPVQTKPLGSSFIDPIFRRPSLMRKGEDPQDRMSDNVNDLIREYPQRHATVAAWCEAERFGMIEELFQALFNFFSKPPAEAGRFVFVERNRV